MHAHPPKVLLAAALLLMLRDAAGGGRAAHAASSTSDDRRGHAQRTTASAQEELTPKQVHLARVIFVILVIAIAMLLVTVATPPEDVHRLQRKMQLIMGETSAAVAGASWLQLTMPTSPRCRRCARQRR